MIDITNMKTPEKESLCINPKVVNFSVDICGTHVFISSKYFCKSPMSILKIKQLKLSIYQEKSE